MSEIKIREWDKDPIQLETGGKPMLQLGPIGEIHIGCLDGSKESLVLVTKNPTSEFTLVSVTPLVSLQDWFDKLKNQEPPKHLVRYMSLSNGWPKLEHEVLWLNKETACEAVKAYNMGIDMGQMAPLNVLYAEYIGEVSSNYVVKEVSHETSNR